MALHQISAVMLRRYKKRHLRNIRTVPQMSKTSSAAAKAARPHKPGKGFIACSVCTVVAPKGGMVAVQRDIFIISYSGYAVKVPSNIDKKAPRRRVGPVSGLTVRDDRRRTDRLGREKSYLSQRGGRLVCNYPHKKRPENIQAPLYLINQTILL